MGKIEKGFYKNKDNKIYTILKLLFSIIISITIILDSALIFNGDINSKLEQTHFNNIDLSGVLKGIVTFVIIYVGMTVIERFSDKIEKNIYVENRKDSKRINMIFFISVFCILILFWLPYLISYFPGGVFADTIAAINQATGEVEITNHNPIVYTLIIKAFFKVGEMFGDKFIGLKILTVVQEIIMALTLTYVVYKMYKEKITMKYISLVILYFGLFELIPLYAVSLWKDVPFSLALLIYILYIWDIVKENGKNLNNYRSVFYYCLISLLVMFFRNNGKYIIALMTIFIIIQYRKNIFREAKKFIVFSMTTVLFTFIIQGPIYNKFSLNGPFNENLGILDQQLCYVVYTNGNLDEKQKEFINKIVPLESIKQHYTPLNIDNIKWGNTSFSEKFIEENKSEYFKIWFQVLLKNPKKYIIAYLYNTVGYWDINKAIFYGYTQEEMWPGLEEKDVGYTQYDFIKEYTGKSIRSILKPNVAISSAIFFFITIALFNLTVYRKKYKLLIIFAPALLTYLSILVAVPLAFTLRYIYILVLTIPLYIILPVTGEYIEGNDSNCERS